MISFILSQVDCLLNIHNICSLNSNTLVYLWLNLFKSQFNCRFCRESRGDRLIDLPHLSRMSERPPSSLALCPDNSAKCCKQLNYNTIRVRPTILDKHFLMHTYRTIFIVCSQFWFSLSLSLWMIARVVRIKQKMEGTPHGRNWFI
jgi:hypothetical protein